MARECHLLPAEVLRNYQLDGPNCRLHILKQLYMQAYMAVLFSPFVDRPQWFATTTMMMMGSIELGIMGVGVKWHFGLLGSKACEAG